MATNFYKVDGSYYTVDGKKVLNLNDLRALASAGGKEISPPGGAGATNNLGTPLTPTQYNEMRTSNKVGPANFDEYFTRSGTDIYAKPQDQNIKRDGADILVPQTNGNLGQWKSGVNLVEAARNIIQRKQKMNTDIQNAKQYWRGQATDTTTWAGQGLKQFSELSPAEQADLRASKYKTAQAHITGLNEEAQYRQVRTEDTLKYVADYYNERVEELEAQKKDALDREKLDIEYRQLAMQEERNRILNEKDISDYGLNYAYDDKGRLIPDTDNYTLPKVNSRIDIENLGSGTITSYGSDLWAKGVDIALAGGINADVKIPFNFTILDAGNNGNFGLQVKVKNIDTGEQLWVSHLSNLAPLQSGVNYNAGTSVGKQGNSGATLGQTGIHVDYTMLNTDGSYKTAEETAVALGIGSVKTAGQGIRMNDTQRKEVLSKTDASEDEVKNMSWTEGQQRIANYKAQTKALILTLIKEGLNDGEVNIPPLKEQIVLADGTIKKEPTPEQVIDILIDWYGSVLDKSEITALVNQQAVKISSAFANQYTWE